ncbi:hypothetical protein WSM22_33820 [Cytophagales bacterium WSM2-2]|nr:hypothetical protein WSM22_33820 [Cytophagales bacterium WSM2-2]
MKSGTKVPKTIDEYIAGFPADVQKIMEKLRATIKKAAPGAEEIISYQMPAFNLHGNLVYFGGWKTHIGFYPTSSVTRVFKKELSGYEGSKGTIKFPLDKPIPYGLISEIVKFRVKENLQLAELKLKKKRAAVSKRKSK